MLGEKRDFSWLAVLLTGIILNASISTLGLTQKHREPSTAELSKACKGKGGTWLESYRECEYVDHEWCTAKSGRFDECASACRHNPDQASPCTMQCVPVCIFSGKDTGSGESQK